MFKNGKKGKIVEFSFSLSSLSVWERERESERESLLNINLIIGQQFVRWLVQEGNSYKE
jgi:hypothetical protein